MSNNKGITREYFERKEFQKTFKQRTCSYEASKKELKNEDYEFRRKKEKGNEIKDENERDIMQKYAKALAKLFS